jgi:hypothetical protein
MDLDNALLEFRKFKDRVLPMLEEWEQKQADAAPPMPEPLPPVEHTVEDQIPPTSEGKEGPPPTQP